MNTKTLKPNHHNLSSTYSRFAGDPHGVKQCLGVTLGPLPYSLRFAATGSFLHDRLHLDAKIGTVRTQKCQISGGHVAAMVSVFSSVTKEPWLGSPIKYSRNRAKVDHMKWRQRRASMGARSLPSQVDQSARVLGVPLSNSRVSETSL
jgi:hypothetical protein